jgi:hypothetical protein
MGQQNRGNLVHFLADQDEAEYNRLAKGFSELSNSANAQTRETTYIDDSTDSTITAFQNSWAISGSVYDTDAANDMLFDLARLQVKGDNAVVYMLVCYLWLPSENNPSFVYKGYRQKCAWVPDNDGGGAGGDTVTFSGALNAKGDREQGWISIDRTVPAAWTAEFSTTEPATVE